MAREIWRWTEGGLVFAALCSIFACGFLQYWILKTSPRSIDPALGAIYRISWHGATVYVTADQMLETNILFWGGPLLLLAAVVTNLASRCFEIRASGQNRYVG